MLADAASIDLDVAKLVINERTNLGVSGVPGEEAQIDVFKKIAPTIAESGDVEGGQDTVDEAINTIIYDSFALKATE